MIYFGHKQEKTPFQWNAVNNYMQYNQGRKHFWGHKGKDYGLLESPQEKKKRGKYYPPIDSLNYSHVNVSPTLANYTPPSPQQSEPETFENYCPLVNKATMREQRQRIGSNSTTGQRHTEPFHLRTQPIERKIPNQSLTELRRQHKKHHLSLQSRNVSVSNKKETLQKKEGSPSLHRQFSIQIKPQERRQQTINYHERTRNQHLSTSEINDYRQRIVRVIRKDRKNNPTFCNSLGYPLFCHRYIQ